MDEQSDRDGTDEKLGILRTKKVYEKNESQGREEYGGAVEGDGDGLLAENAREFEGLEFNFSLKVWGRRSEGL